MDRKIILVQNLEKLEFNTRYSCMQELYYSIQELFYHFEAAGREGQEQAQAMNCCAWELKTHLEQDRDEQWIWTFEWMKNKVLRKLGAEVKFEAEVMVEEKATAPYAYYTGLSRNHVRESGFVFAPLPAHEPLH